MSVKKTVMAKKVAMNFLNARVECSNCKESFNWAGLPENAMGSVKCPRCGMNIDQEGNAHAS